MNVTFLPFFKKQKDLRQPIWQGFHSQELKTRWIKVNWG